MSDWLELDGLLPDLFAVLAIPFEALGNPGHRLWWPTFLTSLILALGALRSAGVRARLRAALSSSDAFLDLRYFLLNSLIELLLLTPVLAASAAAASLLGAPVEVTMPDPGPGGFGALELALALGYLLVFDLAAFLTHLAFHKIPLLWPFHAVHHSAEELTPLLVMRVHPVERLITGLLIGAAVGLFQGLAWRLAPEAAMARWQGANLFLVGFFLAGYHLRHSPLAIDWPGPLRRLLISPLHHQLHHSRALEHRDCNLGLVFSFWDRLAGTLRELPGGASPAELRFGEDGEATPRAVHELYLRPFARVAARLRGRSESGGNGF